MSAVGARKSSPFRPRPRDAVRVPGRLARVGFMVGSRWVRIPNRALRRDTGEGELRRMGSLVDVELTRGELVALKETIELTPLFKGRSNARDAIRALLRSHRPSSPLSL